MSEIFLSFFPMASSDSESSSSASSSEFSDRTRSVHRLLGRRLRPACTRESPAQRRRSSQPAATSGVRPAGPGGAGSASAAIPRLPPASGPDSGPVLPRAAATDRSSDGGCLSPALPGTLGGCCCLYEELEPGPHPVVLGGRQFCGFPRELHPRRTGKTEGFHRGPFVPVPDAATALRVAVEGGIREARHDKLE